MYVHGSSVKISTSYFYLEHLLSGILQWRKRKKNKKHQTEYLLFFFNLC